MTHFVLVHGAWHGGWAWDRVTPLLEVHGHTVATPTLRAEPGTRLADHVKEVRAAVAAAPGPVTLVAHSYSGIVAPQAAARAGHGRVERVVLVDGWVTAPGESLLDVAPDWFAGWCRGITEGTGTEAVLPAPDPSTLGVSDAELAAWLRPRLTPWPAATFSDPAEHGLDDPAVRKEAIACLPGLIGFADMARRAGYVVHEIESGHAVMLTRPEELAKLLAAVVGE